VTWATDEAGLVADMRFSFQSGDGGNSILTTVLPQRRDNMGVKMRIEMINVSFVHLIVGTSYNSAKVVSWVSTKNFHDPFLFAT